jgi:hypothetical protein
MSFGVQDILALVLVAVAAAYIGWRSWLAVFRRRAAGCGSGCGKCASDAPKPVIQIEPIGQVSNLPGNKAG